MNDKTRSVVRGLLNNFKELLDGREPGYYYIIRSEAPIEIVTTGMTKEEALKWSREKIDTADLLTERVLVLQADTEVYKTKIKIIEEEVIGS
jgi:hypothetical protein